MIQFDCHAHVYETVRPVDGARYVPEVPAPLADWQGLQRRHGLIGGVIVQVSFLGADNTQMCDALARLDPGLFAGVGVVPLNVGDDALDRLVAAGMRGVRWNLVRGAVIPTLADTEVRRFLSRLRQRGLHLELHLEGPRLAPFLPALADQGIDIVVDHFGLPSDAVPEDDPMIRAVRGLPDRASVYFKFSAHYRVPFDVAPHAAALLCLLPEGHVVWGSDWPHTQNERRASFGASHDCLARWGLPCDAQAVRHLYGLEQPTAVGTIPRAGH